MAADPETVPAPATLAKAALRRLAQARLEPTPENYARAYAEEAGTPAGPGRNGAAPGWPALVERLARNLERGGRQWTTARRKESLFRLLDSSRSDEERFAQRLRSLLQAWEGDRALDSVEPAQGADALGPAGDAMTAAPAVPAEGAATLPLVRTLGDTVCAGLGEGETRAAALAARLREATARLPQPPEEITTACDEARRWFGRQHEVTRQLKSLCAELSQGLVELSEDESWSRGQCEALRLQLGEGIDLRGLRAAGAMLADTRARQAGARREREAARAALKQVLAGMIGEVGALQQQAGGFESAIARHAEAVQAADSLEGLASVVQSMLAESREMRSAIGASHERLVHDSRRAAELEARVRDLETQLRRLSDEASTDALTQVANRRGLEQHFAAASAHAATAGEALAVGLIDIDNFKKLNDRLGHAAGDQALKALASEVRTRLAPHDQVARFGGEEFVVLLRGQSVVEAQQSLTRLQRSLTASLFLHEGEEVFVTFSAGVTAWRPGEPLEAALERADAGLYEAKRTGKNRTCAA
ncbi:MAG: diguanylate cyclase [Rubrivivax sp.]|nr:diguanylate cyclase [Rubrivivax sp.]